MFNALCENAKAQAANFPFCTIEPNVGIVAVPDPRLDVLRCAVRSVPQPSGSLPEHAGSGASARLPSGQCNARCWHCCCCCGHFVCLLQWLAECAALPPPAACSKISGSEKTVPTSVEFVVRRLCCAVLPRAVLNCAVLCHAVLS